MFSIPEVRGKAKPVRYLTIGTRRQKNNSDPLFIRAALYFAYFGGCLVESFSRRSEAAVTAKQVHWCLWQPFGNA